MKLSEQKEEPKSCDNCGIAPRKLEAVYRRAYGN
jgi:hypothetical protein